MKRALVVAALVVFAAPVGAATICVKAGAAACQPTIQAAVDLATPASTITIMPGVYNENVTIPAGKDGLKIAGTATAAVIVDPDAPLAGSAFVIGSPNVSLRNLTIRNGRADAVVIGADGVVVQGLKIVGVFGNGIFAAGAFTGLQIVSNEIRGIAGEGIVIAGATKTVVKGNVVSQATIGIEADGDSPQVSLNRVQVVNTGMSVNGATPAVSSNTVQLAFTGAMVIGSNPTVLNNRVSIGLGGLIANCGPCSGGLVRANAVDGYLTGIVASAIGSGFVVQQNTAEASFTPFNIGGSVSVVANTASGGIGSGPTACFLVNGSDNVLTKNTVTRCGSVGFLSLGDRNTFDQNVSNNANAFGFEINGFADAVVTGNQALGTAGQGFGITNAATGTTLTGNIGARNRFDACNTVANDFGTGNTFATTALVCDITQ